MLWHIFNNIFILYLQRPPSSGNLSGFETGGGRATTTTTSSAAGAGAVAGNGHEDAASTRSGDTPVRGDGTGGGGISSSHSIRDDTSDGGMDMFAGTGTLWMWCDMCVWLSLMVEKKSTSFASHYKKFIAVFIWALRGDASVHICLLYNK